MPKGSRSPCVRRRCCRTRIGMGEVLMVDEIVGQSKYVVVLPNEEAIGLSELECEIVELELVLESLVVTGAS